MPRSLAGRIRLPPANGAEILRSGTAAAIVGGDAHRSAPWTPPSPLRGGDRATYPFLLPAPKGDARPLRSRSHADALLEIPSVPDRRPTGSHVAGPRRRPCPDLVLDRPA